MLGKLEKNLVIAIVLVVIFGCLFGYAYFYLKDNSSISRIDNLNEDENTEIVSEDAADVVRYTLVDQEGEQVFYKRSADLWVFEKPFVEAADSSKVEESINQLANLQAQKKVAGDLEEFNLVSPPVYAKMEFSNGRYIQVDFGSLNPEQTGYYVKVSNSDDIYLVRSIYFQQIFHNSEYFKKTNNNESE